VWHVIHTLGDGGADRALTRLVCHADPRRFRHTIVTLSPGPGHCALPRHVRVRTASDGRCLDAGLAALHALRAPLPDVIHGWVSFPSVVAAAFSASTGTPLVLRQPTNIEAELQWNPGGLQSCWRELRAAFALADVVIVPSPVLEAGTRRVYDVRRVVAIPNAIEDQVPSRWNVELRRGRSRFVVALVGRLVEQKNPLMLLEALSRLPDVDWELRVYGDGGLRPAMESFLAARHLGPRVQFMGFRRDWRDDAAACDVFVLPARFEGMSNTLLEAAAAGLPIITTDIPENRFLLQPGEALFVAPDGVADLAAAIRRVAVEAGLAAGLSAAASRAPERFTAPAMVRAHEQVYAELARERSRRRAA
jgi:glycosyltransferase involved in cell wall biosynthesis